SALPKQVVGDKGVFAGGSLGFSLPSPLRSGLRELCMSLGITENIFLQTVWGILLGSYSAQEEVVYGSVVSGRPAELEGVEEMIGLFINTIPVRMQLEGEMSVKELLLSVQQSFITGLPHHHLHLSEIQSQSTLGKGLFDHIILFENYPIQELIAESVQSGAKDLRMVSANVFGQNSFDFTVTVFPAEKFTIRFDYNRNVYADEQVESIRENLIQIIQQAIAEVTTKLQDIHCINEAEQYKLLNTFSGMSAISPATYLTVEEMIVAQSIRQADHPAIQYKDVRLSYRELVDKADRLAAYLISHHKVDPDQRIGILLDRSPMMIISILGILRAGGCYVPIDPGYPAARQRYIMEDAGISVLLTQTDYLFGLDFYQGAIIALDVQLEEMKEVLPLHVVAPQHTAYVIYTSGSTGTPKGCVITRHSLSVYISWANSYYFNDGTIPNFGLFTSLSFDLTVTSIFCTLTQGGTLTIFEQSTDLSTVLKESFEGRMGINSIKLTPSHISYLKQLQLTSSTLMTAIVGGEQLSGYQVAALKDINPFIRVYNEYGPTEATVGCIVTALEEGAPILIGKPITGALAYILTKDNELVPIGGVGEICIGGEGLATGYLNKEQLTSTKFVRDPFRPGKKMYRTGDLGRWLPDGNMIFTGRMDEQVKINGYRIEPGEIETALLACQGVDNAVIAVWEREDGEKELAAYVTGEEPLTTTELRAFLAAHLPFYMVPAWFIQLQEIPVTPHGKIDKRRLPDPKGVSHAPDPSYAPPRNELEEQLVNIWQQVLERDKIGINDNFFDVGGNSLRIVRLSNLVSKLLGREISVAMLFEYPSIKSQADHLSSEPATAFVQEETDSDEIIGTLNKFNAAEDDYQ
ncbi:amino acid adenylation domain-containing protein, partial [Chitinophaga sp.]|uniref:non-ribosomal peptide synthetase n=1 Tax=Chitinophaga sp. TaxID=1869181 RepID=UPI0031D86EF3